MELSLKTIMKIIVRVYDRDHDLILRGCGDDYFIQDGHGTFRIEFKTIDHLQLWAIKNALPSELGLKS